jgi:hypothetical protein
MPRKLVRGLKEYNVNKASIECGYHHADSNDSEDSESDQAAQLISHKLTWEVLLLEAEREEQLTWDEQMAKSEKQKQLRPPRLSSLKQEEDKQTIVTAEANVEEKLDDTKLLTLGKRWSTFLYTSLPVTCVVC